MHEREPDGEPYATLAGSSASSRTDPSATAGSTACERAPSRGRSASRRGGRSGRWLLPHRAEQWTSLVPGGILVGVSMGLIGLFNSLLLFPWLSRQEETYGVLGVAAGLLFSFFPIGRAVEVAASLNATMWEQRRRTLPR